MRLHNDAVAALGAARRSEQRYALAAAGSNDGLWDWDIAEGALYCSERWKLMLGLSPQTSVRHDRVSGWRSSTPTIARDWRRRSTRTSAGRPRTSSTSTRAHHSDGQIRWVLCRGIAVRDERGQPIRMAGSQTDVTEWRRVQDTLATAARHDHLTGLPEPAAVLRAAAAIDCAERARGRRRTTRCCSSTSTASSWSTTAWAIWSATSSWWRSRRGSQTQPAARRRPGPAGRRRVRRADRRLRDARRGVPGRGTAAALAASSRSASAAASCTRRPASASCSAGRSTTPWTTCCATPTSRCTAPRPPAAAATSCSTR